MNNSFSNQNQKLATFLNVFLFVLLLLNGANARDDMSRIKQLMIEESVSRYPGHCACPYNLASNGSRCGARSAYSRKGGYAPMCYEQDIDDNEALEWARKKGIYK